MQSNTKPTRSTTPSSKRSATSPEPPATANASPPKSSRPNRWPYLTLPTWPLDKQLWAKLRPTDKAVYVVLAKFKDRTGLAWPAVATLARLAGVDRRNVQRALRRLTRHKLIRRVKGPWRTQGYAVIGTPPRQGGTTAAQGRHPCRPGAAPLPPRGGTTAALTKPTNETRELNQGTTTEARAMDGELQKAADAVGLTAQQCRDLIAKHGQDKLRTAIAAAKTQSNLRSPAAWIIAALRDGYDLTPKAGRPDRADRLMRINRELLARLAPGDLAAWAKLFNRTHTADAWEGMRKRLAAGQYDSDTFLDWIREQTNKGAQPQGIKP